MVLFFCILGVILEIFFLVWLSYHNKKEVEKKIAEGKEKGTPLFNAFYDFLGAVLSCNPTNHSAKEELIKENFRKIFEDFYFDFNYFESSSVWKHLNDGSGLADAASLLVETFDLSHRRSIIRLLFKLAVLDDGIKNDEWHRLLYLMSLLKLNKSGYDYFIRQYVGLRTESDDYSSQQQSSGSSSSSSSSSSYTATSSVLSADYVLLGLTSSATRSDVQDAYHKLALQYHPDLPKNAGNQQFCIDQMAKINAAYDRIMPHYL